MSFIYLKNESLKTARHDAAPDGADGGITITGYDGAVQHLIIPDRIDGHPVTAIAKSAFSRRNDILYVSIPKTVGTLNMFAFYFCRNLKKVVMYDSIDDYYDGVFRQCTALDEFEITVTGYNFSIVKDLLSESDRTMKFLLHLPDGDARLIFPEYLFEYQEDTFARAFHSRIDGAGFTYRECVGKASIDFREYDAMFARMAALDAGTAAEIALDRLCYPYGLTDAAQEAYSAFLKENDVLSVKLAVKSNRKDWIACLVRNRIPGKDAVSAGLDEASSSGNTAAISSLMELQGGRKRSSRFEL